VVSPIQDPGSGFFSGHRVVRVIFLNQNNVVLIIQQSQRIATRFLTGSCRVNHILPGQPGHTGFFLPLFFLQSGLVSVSGRSDPGLTRRAGFQNYSMMITNECLLINFYFKMY